MEYYDRRKNCVQIFVKDETLSPGWKHFLSHLQHFVPLPMDSLIDTDGLVFVLTPDFQVMCISSMLMNMIWLVCVKNDEIAHFYSKDVKNVMKTKLLVHQ